MLIRKPKNSGAGIVTHTEDSKDNKLKPKTSNLKMIEHQVVQSSFAIDFNSTSKERPVTSFTQHKRLQSHYKTFNQR